MYLQEDYILFEKIKQDDKKAFETLFHRHYGILCHYATHLIKNEAEAEEIAQELFVRLWEKREKIQIDTSLKNYLFRAVKNQCLNYIQHNQIKNQYAQKVIHETEAVKTDESNYPKIGLLHKIEESINSLPEKRQEIFRLSRQQGLKYREIAEKLNISVKTVETQMGLSIKTLREKLKHYSGILLFFI
ncbi:RNA polymerase sigma-70 factor, ECF subfamily [Tangfeifania diversioriginum]|uniref:RNA polymerase sigma-70 factor, ECF subfamily n=1 Tax=Tangfeifania diversioriginum TaxID=1168035 RepID=A0A1M6FCA9_9BACT|nr:RNA polymerase sigma-70 factor [Tangfeifania diversioriginum]SHI95394.1 RNA polymerase sigma-70 factor, ECF subfamily [Tangfeifania diversioriginum]